MPRPSVRLLVFLAFALVVPGVVQAEPEALGGTWRVDLRGGGDGTSAVASSGAFPVTTRTDSEGGRLVERGGDLDGRVSGYAPVAETNRREAVLRGVSGDAGRWGAMSSLIGGRQLLDFLLDWLLGGAGGRVR